MGISGLLPFFEKVQKNTSLKNFAGKRVAVDGNVWLHRGAFTCSQELALNQQTTAYVTYFMKQVDLLLFYKVDPVIVFDGATLPIKSYTNDQRRLKRQEAKDLGNEHLRHGRLEQARESFQKAISITPHMTTQVINALIERNIKYIQAPYEADPQLAYLCKKGYVSAVISEDSDLLVYGCPTILFKMNAFGDAIQINSSDMFADVGKGFDFTHWDTTKLRHWCILSGCDYLPSISGVGLKTAYKYINHYKTASGVIRFLRRKGKDVDASYETGFAKANDAFLYQYVYVPGSPASMNLTPLPKGKTLADYPYLGKPSVAPGSIAQSIPSIRVGDKSPIYNASNLVSDKMPSAKKPKTMQRSPLGSITNTYSNRSNTSDTPSTDIVKHSIPPISSNSEQDGHDNKENIAPWFAVLFTSPQRTTTASRRATPDKQSVKQVSQNTLAHTDVIIPSNADALFSRLRKRPHCA
ncbi:PIN domain-like protein [Absidia repens]|uniref:PIN domain-like protein n=1 Tax=Absidia repens TaxID=90262 RepID=A0A1X2ITK4_9FUNG|nr:PIN domain-like protein [Absidia repens]